MSPQDVYKDYKTLQSMNAALNIKVKTLEALVSQCTNTWRVVGITKKALQQFADQDFEWVRYSGIQRAHKARRHDTYSNLLKEPATFEEFWKTVDLHDKTVLAVKGERNSAHDCYICIGDPGLFAGREIEPHFAAQPIGYRFGAREKELLRTLYQQHIVGTVS